MATNQMPSLRELRYVNTPLAQTWNYLRVNNLSLSVVEPEAKGKVYEAVPRVFNDIDAGVGMEATNWMVAAAGNGRYIEVPRGSVRKEPLVIEVSAGMTSNVAVMVRMGATAHIVLIATDEPITGEQAAERTAANVSAASTPHPDASCVALDSSASLLRVYVERGGHVEISEFVTRTTGQHLEGVGIHADPDATVEVRQYVLSAGTTAVGFGCDLAGDKGRLDLNTRYYAHGAGTVDINQLCRMRGRDTRAEIHSNGVLADTAKKTVRQTIDLVHGAKGAQGNESDTTLVTGDEVVNKTLPTILCDEEDVAGNHGATIGSVSEEQLSYLAARGLSREEAEALFVRALFDDAFINATTEVARQAVLSHAETVLGGEVAHEISEGFDSESLSEPLKVRCEAC